MTNTILSAHGMIYFNQKIPQFIDVGNSKTHCPTLPCPIYLKWKCQFLFMHPRPNSINHFMVQYNIPFPRIKYHPPLLARPGKNTNDQLPMDFNSFNLLPLLVPYPTYRVTWFGSRCVLIVYTRDSLSIIVVVRRLINNSTRFTKTKTSIVIQFVTFSTSNDIIAVHSQFTIYDNTLLHWREGKHFNRPPTEPLPSHTGKR